MNKDNNALNEYFKGSKDSVYSTLKKKSEFISYKYRSELTEPLMKKLKIEEDYIRQMLEFIEKADKLIEGLQNEVLLEKIKVEFFSSELKEYTNKYFDSIDIQADNQLFKALYYGHKRSNRK